MVPWTVLELIFLLKVIILCRINLCKQAKNKSKSQHLCSLQLYWLGQQPCKKLKILSEITVINFETMTKYQSLGTLLFISVFWYILLDFWRKKWIWTGRNVDTLIRRVNRKKWFWCQYMQESLNSYREENISGWSWLIFRLLILTFSCHMISKNKMYT